MWRNKSRQVKSRKLLFIPPYGSLTGYLVSCVFVCFFCLFVCTVTDFSVAEKARGMKFCMRVGLLSRQVFSLLAKIDSWGVTEAALLPGWMSLWSSIWMTCSYEIVFGWPMCIPGSKYQSQRRGLVGSRNWGQRCRLRPYGGVCILQACCFFCLFVFCTVTDFSVAEKARGMKFYMHVGLLSRHVFSPFGEYWLAGSHGGGDITSGMNGSSGRSASVHGMGIRNWGRRRTWQN